jgi:septal ring factor EnvC (AmiA/AmiB activator)
MEPDEFIKIIQGVIRDVEEGKFRPQEPALGKTEEIFELYSERLVKKLEKKMLDLEKEITERKRAEEELEKHREHLEELVKARTAELQSIVNSMAGREVRMADLKKVIKKLRTQLEEAGLTPVADDPLKEI